MKRNFIAIGLMILQGFCIQAAGDILRASDIQGGVIAGCAYQVASISLTNSAKAPNNYVMVAGLNAKIKKVTLKKKQLKQTYRWPPKKRVYIAFSVRDSRRPSSFDKAVIVALQHQREREAEAREALLFQKAPSKNKYTDHSCINQHMGGAMGLVHLDFGRGCPPVS